MSANVFDFRNRTPHSKSAINMGMATKLPLDGFDASIFHVTLKSNQ